MHDHALPTGTSGAGRHRRRLALVLALVLALLGAEVTVAVTTGSLALLSDAGHLATDVVGLSLALAAVRIAGARAPTAATSFGWYRLEVLAALVNAGLLLGVAAIVAVGAVRRLTEPTPIAPVPLLLVAGAALVVNVLCAWLLRPGAEESLNLEGARLEVLADAAGSLGVLVAATVIALTGWSGIDTVVAVAISAWLVPRALRLARRSLRVLLQHAPEHADLDHVRGELEALPMVEDVHDLHLWTLTSGMDVASVHLRVTDAAEQHAAQHAARDVLVEATGVEHTTVQVELAGDPDCCTGHPQGW